MSIKRGWRRLRVWLRLWRRGAHRAAVVRLDPKRMLDRALVQRLGVEGDVPVRVVRIDGNSVRVVVEGGLLNGSRLSLSARRLQRRGDVR